MANDLTKKNLKKNNLGSGSIEVVNVSDPSHLLLVGPSIYTRLARTVLSKIIKSGHEMIKLASATLFGDDQRVQSVDFKGTLGSVQTLNWLKR